MANIKQHHTVTNDLFVWTNKNPDVELIEPELEVCVDKNWLVFGNKMQKPCITHAFRIVNNSKHRVAFKVLCSNNANYFMNKKYGVINGCQLNCAPHVRLANYTQITVSRKPMSTLVHPQICDKSTSTPYDIINPAVTIGPIKDRLFILITPYFGHGVTPTGNMNFLNPCARLKVCLEFLPDDFICRFSKAHLLRHLPGWCTWEVDYDKEKKDFDKKENSKTERIQKQKKKKEALEDRGLQQMITKKNVGKMK